MPGAFMQSDLLAKIGAFIQARSDTFTIRSYGSSREQFGSEDGSRAYYEMVVQRTPAYVDNDLMVMTLMESTQLTIESRIRAEIRNKITTLGGRR